MTRLSHRGKKSRGTSSRAAAVATAIFFEPASAYHLSYCITILQFLFEISFLPVQYGEITRYYCSTHLPVDDALPHSWDALVQCSNLNRTTTAMINDLRAGTTTQPRLLFQGDLEKNCQFGFEFAINISGRSRHSRSSEGGQAGRQAVSSPSQLKCIHTTLPDWPVHV